MINTQVQDGGRIYICTGKHYEYIDIKIVKYKTGNVF